jgi:Aminoglycoside-2''-adenylyltransferase
MTEVVQTLTQMALHEIPVARVAALCDVQNAASAPVLEKAGMLRERRLTGHIVHPDVSDQPRDVYLYARSRPVDASMQESDVVYVLDVLAIQQTPVWIAGDWGIDALIERKTRDHMDLDLACRAEDETTIIEALRERGYRIVLYYRPARLGLGACEAELADPDGHVLTLKAAARARAT